MVSITVNGMELEIAEGSHVFLKKGTGEVDREWNEVHQKDALRSIGSRAAELIQVATGLL